MRKRTLALLTLPLILLGSPRVEEPRDNGRDNVQDFAYEDVVVVHKGKLEPRLIEPEWRSGQRIIDEELAFIIAQIKQVEKTRANLELLAKAQKRGRKFEGIERPFTVYESETGEDLVDGEGNFVYFDRTTGKKSIDVQGFDIVGISAKFVSVDNEFVTKKGDYVLDIGGDYYAVDKNGRLLSHGGYQLKRERDEIYVGDGENWKRSEIDVSEVRSIVEILDSGLKGGWRDYWDVHDSLKQSHKSEDLWLAREVYQGDLELRCGDGMIDGVYARTVADVKLVMKMMPSLLYGNMVGGE